MKRELTALFLISVTAAGFYAAVASGAPSLAKFFLALGILACCGFSLQKVLGLEGEAGMLLLRTKRGLAQIDRIAQSAPRLWGFLADAGLVVGFGLASLYLFRKRVPSTAFITGFLCLLVLWQYVLPAAPALAIQLINIPESSKAVGIAGASGAELAANPLVSAVLLAFSIGLQFAVMLGGVAFAAVISIALKAVQTIVVIALFAGSFVSTPSAPNGDILAHEGPGITPIIPGIQIPFTEGILALIVMLVVHEGAHAVLARVAKIPLNSAGVVLFGILPMGAFVDPDEKALQKMPDAPQNRVLVAGSSANLVTAVLFLGAFLAFQYAAIAANPSAHVGEPYVAISGVSANGSAYGVLEAGMVVTRWRGTNISTVSDFATASNNTAANSTVAVVTDRGEFNLTAGENGKVGVGVLESAHTFADLVRSSEASNPAVPFLFNFLGLCFVLNLLVGMMNLIPVPPFDGYRIAALRLGGKKLYRNLKAIDALVLFIVMAFAVNLLPWLWTS